MGKRKKRTRVGSYTLGKTLGQGMMGTVVHATHAENEEDVYAIKIITKRALREGDVRRVVAEAAIMRRLHHPHIVKLHDVLETSSRLYLVTEFMGGGELFTLVEQHGRLGEAQARVLLRHVAEGLYHCHRNNVAHRDIKLQNILLDETHTMAKITDFGMSAPDADARKLLATACGTPFYVAPEITYGQGYVGLSADVWSFGVCVYAAVVGSFPFFEESVAQVLAHVRRGVYTVPDHVSHECRSLIGACLHVSPAERPTMGQVLEHPWLLPRPPSTLPASWSDSSLDDWVWVDDDTSTVDVEALRGHGVTVRPKGSSAAAATTTTAVTTATTAAAPIVIPPRPSTDESSWSSAPISMSLFSSVDSEPLTPGAYLGGAMAFGGGPAPYHETDPFSTIRTSSESLSFSDTLSSSDSDQDGDVNSDMGDDDGLAPRARTHVPTQGLGRGRGRGRAHARARATSDASEASHLIRQFSEESVMSFFSSVFGETDAHDDALPARLRVQIGGDPNPASSPKESVMRVQIGGELSHLPTAAPPPP